MLSAGLAASSAPRIRIATKIQSTLLPAPLVKKGEREVLRVSRHTTAQKIATSAHNSPSENQPNSASTSPAQVENMMLMARGMKIFSPGVNA